MEEVAVEVDTVGVLAGVGGDAVGIEDGHDPHGGVMRIRASRKQLRHRDPGWLVAVDATHHKHRPGGVRISDEDGADRAMADQPGRTDSSQKAT